MHEGLELVVASRASVPGDTSLAQADALLQRTLHTVLAAVARGGGGTGV